MVYSLHDDTEMGLYLLFTIDRHCKWATDFTEFIQDGTKLRKVDKVPLSSGMSVGAVVKRVICGKACNL